MQITTRLEQIGKARNKLYEHNALGAVSQERYDPMPRKPSEECSKRSLPDCKRKRPLLRTPEKKRQKTAEIWFDEKVRLAHIRTRNTGIKEASACIGPPQSGDLPADGRSPGNWLHQAGMMWICSRDYAILLLQMCDTIGSWGSKDESGQDRHYHRFSGNREEHDGISCCQGI